MLLPFGLSCATGDVSARLQNPPPGISGAPLVSHQLTSAANHPMEKDPVEETCSRYQLAQMTS